MVLIKTYHVKHRRDFTEELDKAKLIAEYAVENKNNSKLLVTSKVKQFKLHSDIACQILRKYGRGNINEAKNVNLIIPNTDRKSKYVKKDGTTSSKIYNNITYENGIVNIIPINQKFRWNPGVPFKKINQIEINNEKFMISVSFPDIIINKNYKDVLGIDLNCGIGRSIVNAANLKTGEILNLGKQGPNIRKYYYKKRKTQRIKGNKEKRIMKDLDHKISRKIINYALKHKLKIVLENLKGIRKSCSKGNGLRNVNRFVNSWSFYRLQQFIEYKSKEHGLPFEKVEPHYTSKECSYCGIIGSRNGDQFICGNKKCSSYRKIRHADINAAFNIGKRSLFSGGRA